MKYVYPAIIQPGEKSGYWIRFPDLQGCYSQGETLPDIMEMAQFALSEWLQYLTDEKQTIPLASPIRDVKTETEDEFVTLVYAAVESSSVAA